MRYPVKGPDGVWRNPPEPLGDDTERPLSLSEDRQLSRWLKARGMGNNMKQRESATRGGSARRRQAAKKGGEVEW